MRAPHSTTAIRWLPLALATALSVSACTTEPDSSPEADAAGSSAASSDPTSSGAPTVLESASASSTVPVPQGTELTAQGSELSFGTPATLIYEPRRNRGTVLEMTVREVRRGRLADFAGFILDDTYKRKGSYYYATVAVRNVGRGDVGGVPVPLWGVNAANTLLPAVSFTTRFPPCPTRALPATFPPGASLRTCLVYLSPDRGALTSVSYRPTEQFDPVTWSGPLTPAAKKAAVTKPAPERVTPTKPAGTRKPAGKKKPAGQR
jgi:hypothetical protein